jgi:hypothetical protein
MSVGGVSDVSVWFYPPAEGTVGAEVFEASVARAEEHMERVVVADSLVAALIDLVPDVTGRELPPLVEMTFSVDYLDEGGERLADAGVTCSLVVDPRHILAQRAVRGYVRPHPDQDALRYGAPEEAARSQVDVGAFYRKSSYDPGADEGDYG